MYYIILSGKNFVRAETAAQLDGEKYMLIYENIMYSAEAGEYGAGDLLVPDECSADTPLALAVHGGAWSSLDKCRMAGIAGFLCETLHFAVFNINYRLAGAHNWPAGGDDCLAAAHFLAAGEIPQLKGIKRKALLVVGASSGGHYALMTGLRLPREMVTGIISISGINSVREDHVFAPGRYHTLFGHEPSGPELDMVDPVKYLTQESPPILCTHDRGDNVVPCRCTAHFTASAKAAGVNCCAYYHDRGGRDLSHRIFQGDSVKLYPDLEECIAGWIRKNNIG